MTDEERQAQIDFLIEANVRYETRFARYEAKLARDEGHIRELQESFKLLGELARHQDERQDTSDARTANLNEAFQTLADIAARQDERIRALENKG